MHDESEDSLVFGGFCLVQVDVQSFLFTLCLHLGGTSEVVLENP